MAVRAYLFVYHRLEIVDDHLLPVSGPFIMVANHTSHLDAICLRAALPRRRLASAFTLVAGGYFSRSLLRQTSAQLLANAAPISHGLQSRCRIRDCRSLLADESGSLLLFPEGTRSINGQLGAFRPGIGALAAGSRCPVIPCAIQGAFDAWPKGKSLPRPNKIRVIIGQPRLYESMPRTRQAHHCIADELRSAVESLLCR